MSTEAESVVEVRLDLESDYRFLVDFGLPGGPTLIMDEPPPLGVEGGPNAARALAAAVGNCLSASLLFCLRKAHIEVLSLHTTVQAAVARNEHGRLRVREIRVQIRPDTRGDGGRITRCLELFEDYCVVTEAVRAGLPVTIDVQGAEPGTGLPASPADPS